MKALTVLVILFSSSIAWGLDDIQRDIAESNLAEARDILERGGSEFSASERAVLETRAAMLEARLDENDAEEFRLEEKLYLLSRAQDERTKTTTLWEQFYIDHAGLLRVLSICLGSAGIGQLAFPA